jgi:hypothetical protein
MIQVETKKRSTFLSVLCVLTWIGSALAIILAIYGLGSIEKSYEMTAEIQELFNNLSSEPPQVSDSLNSIGKAYENRFAVMGISLVSAILCIIGAMLMWKLKKTGFFIYLLGEIAPIVTAFTIGGGLLGASNAVFFAVTAIIFIILYSINLKHLNN